MEAKKSEFQFSNPIIKSSHFIVNEMFEEKKYDGLDICCAQNVKRQNQQSAKLDLKITIGDKTEEYPFFIEVVMSAEFQWGNSIQASVDELLNNNGVALLISYARPHIAYLTSNAGFSAYHLPYINVWETLAEEKDSK